MLRRRPPGRRRRSWLAAAQPAGVCSPTSGEGVSSPLGRVRAGSCGYPRPATGNPAQRLEVHFGVSGREDAVAVTEDLADVAERLSRLPAFRWSAGDEVGVGSQR
jgi:hypothetical protein